MKITDILSPDDVLIGVRAINKRQLLKELAAKAAISVGLGVDQVSPYLLKREELGSTGVGGGIAIPHARLPDLQRPFGLLAKLNRWNSTQSMAWRSTSCFSFCCPRMPRTSNLERLRLLPGR
jgi:mannitol/fructose-specific phosphotransferase system IIA component (Ntr-type)